MKIRGNNSIPNGPFGPAPASPPTETSETPEPAAGDQIEISTESRDVQALKDAIGAMPEVRLEKIEVLKDAIEDGSYYVESETLAKHVVNEVLLAELHRGKRIDS